MSLRDHLDPAWLERRLLAGEAVMIDMQDAVISLRPPAFSSVGERDLKELGFPSRRKGLLAEGEHCLWWIEIKDRRSRIVMKDGRALETAQAFLREHDPERAAVLWLITSAPVCSKTKLHLAEHGIMLTLVAEETNG